MIGPAVSRINSVIVLARTVVIPEKTLFATRRCQDFLSHNLATKLSSKFPRQLPADVANHTSPVVALEGTLSKMLRDAVAASKREGTKGPYRCSLRCLGARDSNHDPLANRIAGESNRAI